ncbi:AGC/AKT protein kinase [Puccinia striiformis f. sp. tritici PST-78]|uniref:AGC/AKT protein kinase n=1 Tax=Puccinia striiformis f. sp. tritici PST-78 TaxID=1165861 RepID=A0A0L0W291_9BASI|nr:AGC/AKT protein kinase [Puccinia striiformis f. sp. tritici PST-78]
MSSSLLNVWGRGNPIDQQLTPKASAQSGTSKENNPFDSVILQTPTGEPSQYFSSTATDSLKAFSNKNLFDFTQKPITRSEKETTTLLNLPPLGLLSVKIIQAQSLKHASSRSRPYVFAQFDNNEFTSREPISEEEEEARGVSLNKTATTTTTPRSQIINLHPRISTEDNGNGFCLSGQNPVWKQEVDFDVTHHQPSYSTHHSLYLSIYDRSLGDTTTTTTSQLSNQSSSVPGIEGVEAFLGETEIKLDFDRLRKANHAWVDQWYPLTMKKSNSDEEEGERSIGKIRIQLRYSEFTKTSQKKSLDVADFEFLKMIGKGTFGRVFQVRKKDTKRIYAMKVLSKKEVIDKKEVQHTIGERNILQQSSDCPFLLGLKFSFQSPGELFLVMDYKSGGELFHHLQKEGRFTEERARFYTAEIVLALEHLHQYNIVYRDLKPENILLDAMGHIVLCDFGLSKPNLNPDELTTTFCGTTEYLAPEVLLDDHGYSKLVDFWSLGVLLFEMCCGWSPFYAEDNQQMYKNICFGKIKFPRGVIGDDGKQFVKGLLNRNPKHRLGSQNDTEDLKKHAFFSSINFDKLRKREIIPTFKPHIESDESVSNFDSEFTTLNIDDHLPTTIKDRILLGESLNGKELKVFDENDRSNDWVKNAIHVHHSIHSNTSPSKKAYENHASFDTNSVDLESANPVDITPLPTPIPSSSSHTQNSYFQSGDQDQFFGFSYHGESELMNNANHHNSIHHSLSRNDEHSNTSSPGFSPPISPPPNHSDNLHSNLPT